MRLKSLEKKFKKNPEFYKSYKNTMKDYINKGHASKLLLEELKQTASHTNYIPRQGVKNVNKPEKVRVVFDAGAKFQSTSLNENLFEGPDLLDSLIGVLIRFRKEEFALCGGIEQMFHQIIVHYNDRDALRFLWREHMFDPIEAFKMNVHLFRKINSPCIANWTLQKTVKDNKDQISFRSSRALLENFYMDDYLDSFPTTQKAIKTCIELIKTLSSGGFKLTKFISNSPKILKELLPYGVSQKHSIVDLDLQNTPIQRALGVLGDTENDLLKVKTIQKDISMTKRGLLSLVSSIFDSLEILTRAIIEPKQIIQLSWQRNIHWGDPLPLDIEI